eukprot:9834-Heterococcus_DN1.PRE.15
MKASTEETQYALCASGAALRGNESYELCNCSCQCSEAERTLLEGELKRLSETELSVTVDTQLRTATIGGCETALACDIQTTECGCCLLTANTMTDACYKRAQRVTRSISR